MREVAKERSLPLMTSTDPIRQNLQNLRNALLRLHKTLLDFERLQYEQVHGRIPTSSEFFQLVIGHEQFLWLRPLSQFIVQMDEAMSSKEPITLEQANELRTTAGELIQPSETGTLQEERYFRAIGRDPDVALRYADVSDLLANKP